MFCRKCGSQIPDDSEFCFKCGTAVNDNIETTWEEPKQIDINIITSDTDASVTSESIPDILAPTGLGENKTKLRHKILPTIILIAIALPVVALIVYIISLFVTEAHLEYQYHLGDDGNYIIDKYVGWDINVTIPETINNTPVTFIGENAFRSTAIKSVTINNNKIEIGDYAFYDCKSLCEVKISRRNNDFYRVVVGESAFESCESLRNIDLTEVIKTGSRAFAFSGIEEVSSHADFGNNAFLGCQNLKSVSLGSRTNIAPGLFENCSNLETVNWSVGMDTVTSNRDRIGDGAFYGCISLREFNLNGVPVTDKFVTEVMVFGEIEIEYSRDTFKDCPFFNNPESSVAPTTQHHEGAATFYLGKTMGQVIDSTNSWEIASLLGPCLRFYDTLGTFDTNYCDYYNEKLLFSYFMKAIVIYQVILEKQILFIRV